LGVGTSGSPLEKFYVNGDAKIESDFTVNGNSNFNNSTLFNNRVNIVENLGIGIAAFSSEKLYVNGTAKIESSLTVAGDANMTGNAFVTNNLNVGGKINMGYIYQFSDYSIMPGQTMGITISCPAGTQLLSGGGGNNVFNGGTDEVNLNYNGPNPDAPLNTWRINARNTGNTNRPLRIYCICARIN
jgi:hypothetical protein